MTAELIRPAGDYDEIDRLRDYCRAIIDQLPHSAPRSERIALARSKLDEMIFWLRADDSRRRRDALQQSEGTPCPTPNATPTTSPSSTVIPSSSQSSL